MKILLFLVPFLIVHIKHYFLLILSHPQVKFPSIMPPSQQQQQHRATLPSTAWLLALALFLALQVKLVKTPLFFLLLLFSCSCRGIFYIYYLHAINHSWQQSGIADTNHWLVWIQSCTLNRTTRIVVFDYTMLAVVLLFSQPPPTLSCSSWYQTFRCSCK